MTASDELSKLSARAKEAEDHAAAARTKARDELEQDVKSARASAQAQAENLSHRAARHKGRISEWWDDVEEIGSDVAGMRRGSHLPLASNGSRVRIGDGPQSPSFRTSLPGSQ